MSNQHKESVTVSSAALSARLHELVAVVVKGEINHREFSMRVPAEHDRDADLVMNEAANRLIKQQAEIDALKAQRDELLAAVEKAVRFVGCSEGFEDELRSVIAKARGDL